MSERVRGFIAFDVEDERVVKRLLEIQKALIETGADLKPVEPQNIHVTLRFLGDVSPGIIDKVHKAMEAVQFKPFVVGLKGVGAFSSLRSPRVIWVGLREGVEELKRIFEQLEPQLRRLGLPPDPKGFSPHVTIARVRTERQLAALVKRLKELADVEVGFINAKCLRLKRSVLTPKGPIYSTLKEVCR